MNHDGDLKLYIESFVRQLLVKSGIGSLGEKIRSTTTSNLIEFFKLISPELEPDRMLLKVNHDIHYHGRHSSEGVIVWIFIKLSGFKLITGRALTHTFATMVHVITKVVGCTKF